MSDLSNAERDQLRELLAERACRTLIERYAYAVDWMDWTGLEALFWPNAFFDYGIWSGDRAAAVPWVAELEAGYQRRLHMLASPRIEILGDRARAEAGATMFMRAPTEDGTGREDLSFARYLFDFERRNGEWRLSNLRFIHHGSQHFTPTDQGGAAFFADGLDSNHPYFAKWGAP